MTTLANPPFSTHRNPIERARARAGVKLLKSFCKPLGASWLVDQQNCYGDLHNTIIITFPDKRTLSVDISLPEDYANAADHAAAFVETETPDEDRFDDDGDGQWTNKWV